MFSPTFFIFNNKHSREYGILVEKMPIITRATKRTDTMVIPGRSGNLHIDQLAYENISKTIECAVFNRRWLDEICSWLQGSGDVIFSNERDKKYRAYIHNEIPFKQVFKNVSLNPMRFTVRFDCQPFKYSVNAENDFMSIIQNNFEFFGKGTFSAEPIITVYGSGNITLTVNGKAIVLTSVSGHITINSEIMDAYRDNANMNMNMQGDFPLLNADNGSNTIAWTGNVSKIEIIPNWRWL